MRTTAINSVIFLGCVFVALASAVVIAQSDRWENAEPHDVPHCDVPPRAAHSDTPTAPCECLGMVAAVHDEAAESCWSNHPLAPVPTDMRSQETETAEVRTCLEEMPTHCEVIGRYSIQLGGKTVPHLCRTRCKPQNCGCADSVACARHSWDDAEYN